MVSTGDRVVVHYVARLPEDGEVVDTTDVDVALESDVYHGHRDYEPLEFEVGEGEVLPAVADAVREMERGESRTVTVGPEDGFGERDADRVVEVPRGPLEAESDASAGVGELVVSENGDAGWITAVDGDTATVDFNHELAGERVEFEVRLLTVEPGDDRED